MYHKLRKELEFYYSLFPRERIEMLDISDTWILWSVISVKKQTLFIEQKVRPVMPSIIRSSHIRIS